MITMVQREYAIRLTVNRRKFRRVLIDPHYEKRHPDMEDRTILSLVRTLEDAEHIAKYVTVAGFEIYVTEPVFQAEKLYRLVWTTQPSENYIGVINAFRRKRAKILER